MHTVCDAYVLCSEVSPDKVMRDMLTPVLFIIISKMKWLPHIFRTTVTFFQAKWANYTL